MKKILFILSFVMAIVVVLPAHELQAADVKKINLNLEDHEISFTFLDLLHGEATLLQTGSGKNFLINTGGKDTYDQLRDKLSMYSIEKIDGLIITNENEEYTANMKAVVEEFRVKELIIPETLIGAFSQIDRVKTIKWLQGDQHELSPGLVARVMQLSQNEKQDKGMILSFTYGKSKLLYMGVTNAQFEEDLFDQQIIKQEEVQIFKVADFAETGTSQDFLERLRPQTAIIFHRNRKFPSQNVIERLHESWIDTYRTKQFGNITIKMDQETYEVITIDVHED